MQDAAQPAALMLLSALSLAATTMAAKLGRGDQQIAFHNVKGTLQTADRQLHAMIAETITELAQIEQALLEQVGKPGDHAIDGGHV